MMEMGAGLAFWDFFDCWPSCGVGKGAGVRRSLGGGESRGSSTLWRGFLGGGAP